MMPTMDVSDAIDTLATGTYTVTRSAASTYSGGRKVAGSTSTLTVTGVMVPLTGRQLERLPEGQRSGELRAFYTKTSLQTAGEGVAADVISDDGRTWEVEDVDDWSDSGGYCVAIARMKGH